MTHKTIKAELDITIRLPIIIEWAEQLFEDLDDISEEPLLENLNSNPDVGESFEIDPFDIPRNASVIDSTFTGAVVIDSE